MNLNDVS
jgi:hypothetical protein